MHSLLYYLLYPLLRIISLLPCPILYFISDILYLALYYVAGYRKKVVYQNLNNSFPELTGDVIQNIAKEFYHNFCDILLETAKSLSISKNGIMRHCTFAPGSYGIFEKLYSKNKHVIIVMGHTGNWEYALLSMSARSSYLVQTVYQRLSNKKFDTLMYHSRSRFGARPIEMRSVTKNMLSPKKKLTTTTFVADQSSPPEYCYWTKFLNQDTPVYLGTEKIAVKLNYPVVFANVKRTKRGFYEIFTELLTENAAETSEGEITTLHTRKLEQAIREQPSNWLWSHRRWKHKRNDS